MSFNRRDFVKSCSAMLGATVLGGFPNSAWAQSAKKSKVLLIGLPGGMSPFLGNAASFVGTGWGGRAVTSNSEVSWDTQVFSPIMATAAPFFGVAGGLGSGSHDGAKNFWYENNDINKAFAVSLANAIGGTSPLKVAGVGPDRIPEQRYEQVTNISSFLQLIGNSVQQNTVPGATPASPNYKMEADLLKASKDLGDIILKNNLRSLNSASLGSSGIYDLAQKLVTNPPLAAGTGPAATATVAVNPTAIMNDYGITSPIITGSMNSKLAAAEILLRSGLNVVSVVDAGGTSAWDTHDDNDGSRARTLYTAIVPALATFCRRMLGTPDMNVTIVFLSEHSRITEKSNHGPHTAVPIFSDSLFAGRSTGICNSGGFLANPQPEQTVRALVAELAKVSVNPFGANTHSRLIRV